MIQDKYLLVMYDPSKLMRIKFQCKCGHGWVEEIPGEAHNAVDIRIYIRCPACTQGYTLCNKKIERFGKPQDPNDKWNVGYGGHA